MNKNRLLIGSILSSSLLFGAGDMAPVTTEVAEIEQSNWSFELEPYMMATSIEGDASLGRATGINVAVDFSDILETLQIGAMVHFEAHHQSGFGVWVDYAFMDLAQDTDGPLGGVIGVGVRQAVLEVFGLYRQPLSMGRIDYMLGARWWSNDFDLEVNPSIFAGSASTDTSKDWVDIVIGANWLYEFSPHWSIKARGDIGGFGLESEFTATTALGFEYAISDLMSLDIQYKATWVDYEDGEAGVRGSFAYDTVTHGPIVGLKFKF